MAYSFQDRLRHNKTRFSEINAKDVVYSQSGTDYPLSVSPIKHQAMEADSSAPSLYRLEMQCFGINVSSMIAAGIWPPLDADVIKYPDGQEFRIAKPDQNSPSYVFTTSSQDRIILYTKRAKGPT